MDIHVINKYKFNIVVSPGTNFYPILLKPGQKMVWGLEKKEHFFILEFEKEVYDVYSVNKFSHLIIDENGELKNEYSNDHPKYIKSEGRNKDLKEDFNKEGNITVTNQACHEVYVRVSVLKEGRDDWVRLGPKQTKKWQRESSHFLMEYTNGPIPQSGPVVNIESEQEYSIHFDFEVTKKDGTYADFSRNPFPKNEKSIQDNSKDTKIIIPEPNNNEIVIPKNDTTSIPYFNNKPPAISQEALTDSDFPPSYESLISLNKNGNILKLIFLIYKILLLLILILLFGNDLQNFSNQVLICFRINLNLTILFKAILETAI
jgi:hypothetical protein